MTQDVGQDTVLREALPSEVWGCPHGHLVSQSLRGCGTCWAMAKRNGRCGCGRPFHKVRAPATGRWEWAQCACGVTPNHHVESDYKFRARVEHAEHTIQRENAIKRADRMRKDPRSAALSDAALDLLGLADRLEQRLKTCTQEAQRALADLLECAEKLDALDKVSDRVRAHLRQRSTVLRRQA